MNDCEGSSLPPSAVTSDPGHTAWHDVGLVGRKPRTLSDRALDLVNGPRQDAYAAPEINLARIGSMWAAILGREDPVEPWRVALMMSALKIARAAHRPEDDALVDAVGYLELVERLR